MTGIVNITAEDYERMPSQFDGQWLRANFPDVAQSMDRFIAKVKPETGGEIVGDLEIVRIPLELYRARNATSRQLRRAGAGDHPFARSPVFLVGDAAMGSPYFQSISLGFECAMFLAGLLAQRDLPLTDMLDRYELLHLQAVASGVHAEQDDQAQQGPVRRAWVTPSRCWRSCTSIEGRPPAGRSAEGEVLLGLPGAPSSRSFGRTSVA